VARGRKVSPFDNSTPLRAESTPAPTAPANAGNSVKVAALS